MEPKFKLTKKLDTISNKTHGTLLFESVYDNINETEFKKYKAILENCGDKGISVGEGSEFKNDYLNVNQSNIGIASKDSSNILLDNVSISNSKTCISAYNKKQEFNGGFINIKHFKCKNYITDIKVDKVSKILINENI